MDGDVLKALRDRTELSQWDFGKVVGYSDKQISNFENDIDDIPDRGAIKIARALNRVYGWAITPFDVSPRLFMALQLEALDETHRPFHIEAYKRSFLASAAPVVDELRNNLQGLDEGKRSRRKS